MIAKCKAIAHGGNALEYVFREGKLGRILALHNLCSETPKEIHEEMKLISDYNSRCKNKFLRIEIGIAPKDEPQMTFKALNRLALLFVKQMGLDDHQWVAVTHKDTDNLHIHIIANRISLGGQIYDTTFVSNRAARVAEELSHKYGLTIANEVRSPRLHRKAQANPARDRTKQQVRSICYALLEKHRGKGLSGHSMFLCELYRSGVTIERMKNKQDKVYGLKFTYDGHSFKASEIGREFGFRTLPKQFESDNAQNLIIQSSMIPTKDNTPIVQVTDPVLDAAESLLSEVGEVITLQTHGADYAEIAWQRRLRNQAVKKKKRGAEDVSFNTHLVVHSDLSQAESQIEEIASKTPVFQIVIVTLHSQMTSALCLCRFQQPQALRSFLPRYPSNTYDQVTSSFAGEYSRIVFSVIKS